MKTAMYAFASAGIIAMSASAASAATMNVTANVTPALTEPGTLTFTFDQFDSSLGTLNSVTILSGGITTSGTLMLANDTSEESTSSGSMTLRVNGFSDVDGVGFSTLVPNTGTLLTEEEVTDVTIGANSSTDFALNANVAVGIFDFSKDWVFNSLSGLTGFIGTDDFSLSWNTLVQFSTVSGGDFTASGNSLTSGAMVIQYDYTPDTSAVPLPAALPLMGAGLAGLAFVARRRKS